MDFVGLHFLAVLLAAVMPLVLALGIFAPPVGENLIFGRRPFSLFQTSSAYLVAGFSIMGSLLGAEYSPEPS